MPTALLRTTVDETALVEFARRWFSCGGGSIELLYSTFGLYPSEYFSRLRVALERSALRVDDPRLYEVLTAVCTRRLWLSA